MPVRLPSPLPLGRFGHPTFDELEAFADDAGGPGAPNDILTGTPAGGSVGAARARRRRVARHLARCTRCRRDVRTWRTLRYVMAVPASSPARSDAPGFDLADGLATVLRRQNAGECVLLPPVPPVAPPAAVTQRHSPPRLPARALARPLAAAAAVVALAWAALRPTPTLEAGTTAGTLTTRQQVGPDGRRLEVRYRPALALAGADSLVLRATLYAAGGPPQGREVRITLRRRRSGADGGVYAAVTVLPPAVLRAGFAVASANGRAVDDNDARGWELLAEDAHGRPLFEALWQQYTAYSVADWERAHRAAQSMLRYYPERPRSVRFALNGALELAGPARADSVRAAFRPAVTAVDAALARRPGLDDEALSEMVFLAEQAGDIAMRRRWRDRLYREAPRSAGAVQRRVFDVFAAERSDAARLAALDRLYAEAGDAAPQLPFDAFRLAVATGNVAAVARWGERLRVRVPGMNGVVADAYVGTPSLRQRGADLARTALRAMPPAPAADWRVGLRTPTPMDRQPVQGLLSTLGRALLLDAGPAGVVAARDTLARAAALGRAPGTLRAFGAAALRGGDTAAAATAYAWLVADPHTGAAGRDSLQAQLGAQTTGAPFDAARRGATAAYRDEALAAAVRHPVPGAPTYRTVGGLTQGLDVHAEYTIVAFVSRHCAPSLADLPALDRARRRWAAAGVPVVALVAEQPDGGAVRALGARGYAGPVGFDDRAAVARATRQVATPQYVVIERGATVRYVARSAADVDAFLTAVLGGPAAD